jgi:pilus assembly protein CpaF
VPALRWGAEAFAYERGWERLRGLLRDGTERSGL